MLTSLVTANPASIWHSFSRSRTMYDLDNGVAGISSSAGTNFNVNGGAAFTGAADTVANVFVGTVRNYTATQSISVKVTFYCDVTTGTKTFTASLAAITPGDAQSVLTKAFGTGVVSAATAPNGTVNGPYSVTFLFDTAAKLDNVDNGDFLAIKIQQTAHAGTSGNAYIIGIEATCSG